MGAPRIPTNNLLLYLPFDSQAVDRSPTPATFTVSGSPSYVDGQFGKAINCDATNKYVNAGSTAKLNLTESAAWSINAFIKLTDASNSAYNHFLFAKYNAVTAQYGYYIYISPGNAAPANRLNFFMRNQTGANKTVVYSDIEVPHGIWTHVGVTKAGGTGTSQFKMYINGVETSITYTTNVALNTTIFAANLYINSYSNASQVSRDMQIQHLMMHSVELSAKEISALYHSTKGHIL